MGYILLSISHEIIFPTCPTLGENRFAIRYFYIYAEDVASLAKLPAQNLQMLYNIMKSWKRQHCIKHTSDPR
jgi:uncharacterized membrane protein